MRLALTTTLLLTSLGTALPAPRAESDPSRVDPPGLDTLQALEKNPAEQKAEQERRQAEGRTKTLIDEQLRFQSDLMDASRTRSVPAEVLGDANPRIAPGPPAERELPLAIFDHEEVAIPPGTWGNGNRLKLLRLTLDADGDGRPELRRWIDRESKLQIRREEDRDYDGVTDGWSEYESGEIVSRVLDSNGDGNPDVWERYEKSRMTSREVDRDDDGVRDAFYRYEGDSLAEERHDSNNDDQIDRVIRYEQRTRVSTAEDLDTDGQMDTWTTYTDIGGEEVVTRIERDKRGEGAITSVEVFNTATGRAVLSRTHEDVNGDGEVDVISIYEEGKLVRREISDPSLVEL